MTLRKTLFWGHLVVGVSAAAIVLVLALTGVLLTYEVQMTRWAQARVTAPAAQDRLDVDRLVAAAQETAGGKVTALIFENSAAAPVTALVGRQGKLLLDPYTGAALGDGETPVSRFFDAVTSVHRWLSFTGFSGLGKLATGVANLCFGGLALTGAYLWVPRIWKWTRLKALIFLRRDYPNARVRDFHWHHVFAFWSLIPLLVIIGTGVTLSYERAEGLVMSLAGVGAQEETPGARDTAGGGEALLFEKRVALEQVLGAATAFDPAWRRVTLTLPAAEMAPQMTAVVDTGPGRRMTRQKTLTISLADARVADVRGFGAQPKAARTFAVLRFAHTGEHFGIVGQSLAGLASLATLFMVYTGLALAWRRLGAPLVRRLGRSRGT